MAGSRRNAGEVAGADADALLADDLDALAAEVVADGVDGRMGRAGLGFAGRVLHKELEGVDVEAQFGRDDVMPAGAPLHQRGVFGGDVQPLLLAPALDLERDAPERHLLLEVAQVEGPRLQFAQFLIGEVADLRRLVGSREVHERRGDLAVGAGELLRREEDQRLGVRVLGAVPDVGGHVAEVADLDVEPGVFDEFLAAALDVVLQRVAVRVVALGAAGAPGGEHVQVVDVEAQLRADDDALIRPRVRHVGLVGGHVDASLAPALVDCEGGAAEVLLLLHVERVQLVRRELGQFLRNYACGRRHRSLPARPQFARRAPVSVRRKRRRVNSRRNARAGACIPIAMLS